MLPRSPGPSSTTRGAPVSRTVSPGFTPLVSSYTWMTVLISSRRSSSSRLPTARTPGRGVLPSRCRRPWLRALMSSALRIRMPTFASSRTFATCASNWSRATLKVLRTPASLNPWTNSSRPTAASSISDHQEFSDDFRGQAALLPAGDDSQVLDLAVLPDNVIEDNEDGERIHMGVPTRLQEMEFLNRSDQLPHAEVLEVFEPRGEVLREGVVSEAGREAVHVQGDHLGEFCHGNLEASLHEGFVWQSGFRGPKPQEGFQIHDVDLAADEFPHEPSPLRAFRDHGEEALVVQFRDEVLPLVPPLDLGRFLAQRVQSLGMNRPIEPVEHLVHGRQLHEALEERFPHAPRGDNVFQDLRRGSAEDLAADDRLHILHVEPAQVPPDHLPAVPHGA